MSSLLISFRVYANELDEIRDEIHQMRIENEDRAREVESQREWDELNRMLDAEAKSYE